MYSSLREFYNLNTIDQHFEKIFTFENHEFSADSKKNLNDFEQFISNDQWIIEELGLIEENLTRVKCKLNNFDNKQWSKHASKCGLLDIRCCFDSFENSDRHVYQKKPELFTRAWIKLHEILVKFKDDLLKSDAFEKDKQINCLFLCEAPGAFITSVNHFIKQRISKDHKLNWLASSLNPYYEENDNHKDALIEDCFIEQTFDQWYFGIDNSGDIQQPKFYETFRKEFENKSIDKSSKDETTKFSIRIDLITGDGGIQNYDYPELQEINSFNLILNETMVALNCLSNGGCFVLKIFSFYNCRTICLIYLIVNLFKRVHMFKPISSKEANGEIYLVCLDYQLNENSHLIEQVTKRFDNSELDRKNVVLFKKEMIPNDFLEKIIESANFFAIYQTNSIERNIHLLEKDDKKFYYNYQKLQTKINLKFKKFIDLKPIKIKDQIIKQENNQNFHNKNRYFDGLNKKTLGDYGVPTSYIETIEEMNRPELKLTKIQQIISSVYIKSKRDLLDNFKKFHQFNSNSSFKVLNPDKFIDQPKMDSIKRHYLNTKFCCEGIIKLNADYELVKPSKSYNINKLKEESHKNEKLIIDNFRSLFRSKSNELNGLTEISFYLFDHIQTNQPNLSLLIEKAIKTSNLNLKRLDLMKKHLKTDDTDIVIHLIDLFNLPDERLRNDEHCLVNFLVLKLNEIIYQLKFNNILVISMPSLLTRYAFDVIYLCNCIFKQFTISPIYLKSNQIETGLIFTMSNYLKNDEMMDDQMIIDSINGTKKDNLDDVEIDNQMDESNRTKFDENQFKTEFNQFKKIILAINCYNLTNRDKQILDFIGVHRLMKDKKYRDFLRLIILANNLKIIETIKLKMHLST